nr:MAG TPA: hypothetical protein [Caudoviricetes sp.]
MEILIVQLIIQKLIIKHLVQLSLLLVILK